MQTDLLIAEKMAGRTCWVLRWKRVSLPTSRTRLSTMSPQYNKWSHSCQWLTILESGHHAGDDENIGK
jgi:hypothetical protein